MRLCANCDTQLQDYMKFCWNCSLPVKDPVSHTIAEIDEVLKRAIAKIRNNPRGISTGTFQEQFLTLLRIRGLAGVKRRELALLTRTHTDGATTKLVLEVREKIRNEGRDLGHDSVYWVI